MLNRRRKSKPVPRKTPLAAYGDTDGLIAGPDEYKRRLSEMCVRQGHRCGFCKRPFHAGRPATFGHARARGMGAAHRDDRIWNEDGTWKAAALCMTCQSVQGSRHFTWQSGEWKPLTDRR